jgi:thiol-disulfide isomerase/thioredoxin
LKLTISAGPYRYYPIRLFIPEQSIYMSDTSHKAGAAGRTLIRSHFACVEGTVNIGGKETLVRYMFDLDKNNAYPDKGWQGMDANGDGVIDEEAREEWVLAHDENVVFHVNGHDVTTVSLDLKSRAFILRELPAGSNPLIPLRMGDVVPDFSFTDLDGKRHRFSEFRGKYVLLDFWGTWCGPCRRELPDLEKVYQQFRARGLVILGMDDDEETEKARKVLSDAGVTYPQSSGKTGSDLVHRRFRIESFPWKVLLDPEGKVIAPLASFKGENIRPTLDKLLPPAK